MTDVTVAPQGSAQSAASNEVAINQNPTATPAPVGSQAPPAPVGDIEGSKHRPESRREAIQKAFERASNPQAPQRHAPKAAPKAAEAKVGHNNPPEETEKFDLKKRPTAPPAALPREQPRDRGKFAAHNPTGEPAREPYRSPHPDWRTMPETTPFRDPPARMSERARQDWGGTPETVRGEMHRQQQEFAKAYNYYRADAEAMAPIRHFHVMAQQHGTTLEQALTNYVSMEQKLRADPIAGLDLIVHNLGLKTPDGQRLGLRDIAYHVLSQSPDQLRAIQQGNHQQAAAHQIGDLHQQVAGLQNALQQMHTHQQFNYTRSAVDQFAESHPRFDELGPVIEQELKSGYDLDTAYRRAEMLHPTTHAAQTRTTSAQTRPTDKSIHGSPDVAPSNGASRRPREASRTPRDAVANAIRHVNGSY
jgi:hypothetical protein